ncbi:MAG: hypothetical protein H6822_15380 [Planctomycetaceae bacterium]|nr:hypothetical protein [Planctomycetales bacterium]MCB9923563.1 hypothetical protein [Planctomycetaceae bacterium]
MTKCAYRGFAAREFSYTIRVCVPFVLLATMFAGCSRPQPSPEELTQWVRDYHKQVDSFLSFQSVEMGDVVEVDDNALRVSFTVQESFKQDAFLPISMEDAYRVYEYDPSLFDQAMQKAMTLRMPERQEALASRPQDAPPANGLFRRAIAAGENFSWNGTIVARQRTESGWEFTDMEGKVEHPAITPETLAKDQLPKSPVVVDSKDDSNRLTQLITEQRVFAEAVDAAEQRMIARLEREHKGLLEIIKNREALLAAVPIANNPDAKLSVRVVYQKNDGEEVVVLVEDTTNPLARACWQGKLALTGPPAGSRNGFLSPNQNADIDGWAIRMQNKSENPFREMGVDANMVLGWTNEGEVRWANLRLPVLLRKNPTAPEMPEYDEYVAQILKWTRPGQMWEGTLQRAGANTHSIRVVFTEFQDNGGNLRLIVERPDEPFTVATFQGTVDTSPAGVFAWPIRMTHSSGQGVGTGAIGYAIPLIAGKGGPLSLTMTANGECYGISYAHTSAPQVLQMKSVSSFSNLEPAQERWRKALRAGDRWSGKIVRGDAPAERIVLTVTEVIEDGRIYRFTMHNPDNVRQFRPFVGTLNGSEKFIDGYAITFEPTSLIGETTHFFSSDAWRELYGTDKDVKHSLRLHSDGKTLLCMSYELELATLTRGEARVSRPLDRKNLVNDWRKLCQTGNRWQGKLTSLELQQSVEVAFTITSGIDDLGNVSAELSLPKMPKLKIPFTGTLKMDDANINAYALQLQKKAGGQSTSLLFGPDVNNVVLNIRLSEDGKGLVGLGSGFHGLKEFMELTPGAAKP